MSASTALFLRLERAVLAVQDTINFKQSGAVNFQFAGDGVGKVGTTGFVLGVVGGFHVAAAVLSLFVLWMLEESKWNEALVAVLWVVLHWSTYVVSLCAFHFLEFFATACYQPSSLSFDSFIVNHSPAYTLAAIACWFEFWLETLLFGAHKQAPWVVFTGVVMVVGGQVRLFRASPYVGLSFPTAFHSYPPLPGRAHTGHDDLRRELQPPNHGKTHRHAQTRHHRRVQVRAWLGRACNCHCHQQKTRQNRVLITVTASVLRHPAYFGFFWWSVGTQVLLCNPLCAAAYALAAWRFFSARIPHEEHLLASFYPSQVGGHLHYILLLYHMPNFDLSHSAMCYSQYPEYARKTYVGIPFLPLQPRHTQA